MGERFSHTSAKRIYVSLILTISSLLIQCRSVSIDDTNYNILVFPKDYIVRNSGDRLYCGDGSDRCKMILMFCFVQKQYSGGVPMIYVYGDGSFMLNPNRYNNRYFKIDTEISYQPNTTYEGVCEFTRPGKMSILFAWKEGRTFHKSVLIHVNNHK